MKTRSIATSHARRSRPDQLQVGGLLAAALLTLIAAPASAQVDRQTRKIPVPAPLQSGGQYMRSPSRQGVLRAKAVIFHPVGKTVSRTTDTSNYFATQAELKKCEAGEPSSLRPSIDTLQGTIESSGDIVLSGRCFGFAGAVVFTGAFPFDGGRFNGETEAWSPDRIRVHIPSVQIFHSTQVSISVFRAVDDVNSDAVTHVFGPEMEDVVLPASQVVSLSCPHDAGQCSSATANHVTSNGGAPFTASNGRPANESGDDRWEAKPPAGWLVDWVEWTTPLGTVSLGPDFMTSPATDAVWTMHWENNLLAPGVQPPGNSVRLSGDSRQYYAASYSMKVHVIGPKGTFPLRRL